MSARVPHRRPLIGDDGILSRLPVSAADQQRLAELGNFCSGHGGHLIPWTAIGFQLTDTDSATYHFYVAPKARAVERVWDVMLSGLGPASVTAGSASAVAIDVGEDARTFRIREPRASKTSAAGDTTITIAAAESGACYVHAISMYEQTRANLDLDATDYGADVANLQAQSRVYDSANQSLRGLGDAHKNVDARRAGFVHWSSGGDTFGALLVTQAGYTDLKPLYPPALGAVVNAGSTSTTFTCAVYAKVNAGSANVRFSSTQNGSNVVNAVSGTSFAWVTGSLTINAEDLTAADGRRSSGWETIRIEAQKGTATTLTIAAISVVRVTAPL